MRLFSNIVAFTKKHRNSLTIAISCIALLLGIFNFHWTFLKDRKVLHLIYVDNFSLSREPQFAVVNGGKSDILITDLSCSFKYTYNKTKTSLIPLQTIEWNEGDSSLLPSGKGFHYKVKFNEEFTSAFVQKGKLETVHNKRQLYMHDMYVDISWIEMDGKFYNKSIKLIKYGFNEEGQIRRCAPVNFRKPINLYK